MSLYRLQRYADGNGDPIDTSDALAILSEVDRGLVANFNKGIDAAIVKVKELVQEDVLCDTLVEELEKSKL